jgi:signal transduction histidine kinase
MGGTGLGLSIVSELAKLQNASVSVKSELAKGSIFTLRFPAEPNPPA